MNSNDRVHDSKSFIPSVTANNKYTPISTESSDHSLPGSFTYPVLCSMQKSEEGKHNLFSSGGANSSSLHRTDSISNQQEQPLDLCKNKGKTITASHQQLIDHFVDKFLCDTPVPQNSYYKSSIIDPAFCKILSEKCASDSSKGGNMNHTSFTLSVAIESAVDKAYSKDSSKSHKVEVPDNSAIIEHITRNSCDFDLQFKTEEAKTPVKSPASDSENISKSNEQNVESTSSLYFDSKGVKHVADSTSTDTANSNSVNSQNESSIVRSRTNENSSSQFFCKMMSPPKKSRVWCDIFMNEQLSKNDSIKNNSHVPSSIASDLPSPARRSSQRTCKGRRYQALITEGLLQSSKERKANNNRKTTPLDKGKNKVNHIIESNLVSGSKKKKKKEDKTKAAKAESPEFNKR